MFDNWYDYLNPMEYLSYGKQELFDKPANQVKEAYDRAAGDTRANAQQIRDFLLGREQRAQDFFNPLQQMFQNAYGTKGIQGPQVPRSPMPSLASLYGGQR